MKFGQKKARYLAIWLIAVNMIALSAMLSAFSITPTYAHEDAIHQQIATQTKTKMVDGKLMLELSLNNFSGKTLNIQSLNINGSQIDAINQTLSDDGLLELKQASAIQIPNQYLGSMFLSLELDMGQDGVMMIPIVVAN